MRFRIALLTLGMAAWGYAQTLAADIPFQFHIGEHSYAAGRYLLSAGVSSADSQVVWAIRSSETGKTVMFHTEAILPAEEQTTPRLIFNKYLRTYFLSKVWADGRTGLQLTVTKREREMAKAMPGGEVVAVNLRR